MKRIGFLPLALLAAACGSQAPEPEDDREPAASPAAEPQIEAATEAPATPGRISRYTSLKKCRQLELEEDEGGWSLQRCKGEGGYGLLVSEGDLRQNILLETPKTLGKDNARSLDLSKGTGGGFSRVGDTAEWRGPSARAFKPDVLIVRFGVADDAERPDRETSWLLVFALKDGNPCLVDRIAPGAGQSDAARLRADGPLACASE